MQEQLHPKKAAEKTEKTLRDKAAARPRTLAAFARTARGKRAVRAVLALCCFVTALLAAGTRFFPGSYPFGVALAASAGGILSAVSVTLGALIGSARIPTVGGVYAAAFVILFALRAVLSCWLALTPSPRAGSGAPDPSPLGPPLRSVRRFFSRVLSVLLDDPQPAGPSAGVSAFSSSGAERTGEDPSRFRPPVTQGGSYSPEAGKVNVGTVLREHIRIRMALSAFAALFAGAWSVVAGGYETYDLFGAVFSVLVTPLFTYLFYAAAERNMRASFFREFGVCALLAVCAASLGSLSSSLFSFPLRSAGVSDAAGGIAELAGEGAVLRRTTLFDVGALFSLAVTLVFARQYGWHRGALAGLLCGMASAGTAGSSLSAGLLLAPMYPLCAAAYAILDALRLPAVFPPLGAGVAAVAWGIFTGGVDGFTRVLPPAAVACAVLIPLFRGDFIRLPRDLFGFSPFLPAAGGSVGEESGENGVRGRMRRAGESWGASLRAGRLESRVNSLADGLASVSALLRGLDSRLSKLSPAEARGMVEECFARHCSGCPKRSGCRDAKLSKTEPLARAMTDSLCREGSVSAALIPASLASQCAEMGEILGEVNLAAGERRCGAASGSAGVPGLTGANGLESAASDWELAGELFDSARRTGEEAFRCDRETEKKLGRLLSLNGFSAESVRVWGTRERKIFAGGVDLCSTRMGADEIRRLFERIVGQPLSAPEFEIDGSSLLMRLSSVSLYSCRTGSCSCAASSVHTYWCDSRGCGADSGEHASSAPGESGRRGRREEEEKPGRAGKARVEVSDREPREVCGDVITDFEAYGKQYMILSDGMGSGREAALSSGMAVSLLEKLIRAGAEPGTALKMLNRILRSTGRECSATVDVAEIDLCTGEARFVKSGAAPSFVLRDGSIFRLQSKTVPVGILRALDAEMIRFDVQAGDTVVMVSDGAARSYDEDPWLLDLLSSSPALSSGDETSAAETVVAEAARRGSKDDITCGIMRIGRAS